MHINNLHRLEYKFLMIALKGNHVKVDPNSLLNELKLLLGLALIYSYLV
jgi:hypothetical protein